MQHFARNNNLSKEQYEDMQRRECMARQAYLHQVQQANEDRIKKESQSPKRNEGRDMSTKQTPTCEFCNSDEVEITTHKYKTEFVSVDSEQYECNSCNTCWLSHKQDYEIDKRIIKALEQKLAMAIEALEFYSKPYENEGAYVGQICLDRVHGNDREVIGAFSIAGKRARDTLSKLKSEG